MSELFERWERPVSRHAGVYLKSPEADRASRLPHLCQALAELLDMRLIRAGQDWPDSWYPNAHVEEIQPREVEAGDGRLTVRGVAVWSGGEPAGRWVEPFEAVVVPWAKRDGCDYRLRFGDIGEAHRVGAFNPMTMSPIRTPYDPSQPPGSWVAARWYHVIAKGMPRLTDDEWLASADPNEMLFETPRRWTDRRSILVGVACLRRAWHLPYTAPQRDLVEAAEAWALRGGSDKARRAAIKASRSQAGLGRAVNDLCRGWPSFDPIAGAVASGAGHAPDSPAWIESRRAEFASHADIIRDVLGFPRASPAFDPEWLAWDGGAVPAIARGIDEAGDYSRVPILGDALEDAGCRDGRILDHCRGGGVHVPGCWVVDAILGRE